MVTPVYSRAVVEHGAVVMASEQRKPFHRQALRPWQLVVRRVESYSTPRALKVPSRW